MHAADDKQVEQVLTWAYRSLYVLLFISLVVVMGYWRLTITYTFLASVICLLLPLLFSKDILFKTEERDTNDADCSFNRIETAVE